MCIILSTVHTIPPDLFLTYFDDSILKTNFKNKFLKDVFKRN